MIHKNLIFIFAVPYYSLPKPESICKIFSIFNSHIISFHIEL